MTVKFSDIETARERLKNIIIPTPMISDARLSREVGANAHLKAECLQKSGSFKIRGGYNKISRLSDEEKSRGVIAASAGNHAQGVALAASLLNIKSTIVLPVAAPLIDIPRSLTDFFVSVPLVMLIITPLVPAANIEP